MCADSVKWVVGDATRFLILVVGSVWGTVITPLGLSGGLCCNLRKRKCPGALRVLDEHLQWLSGEHGGFSRAVMISYQDIVKEDTRKEFVGCASGTW